MILVKKKAPLHRPRLGQKAWLALLVRPGTRIDIDFHASPSRLVAPAGWDTNAQRIPEHLVYFVAEGRCAAVLDQKRVWPSAGALCWIAPGTTFRFFARAGDSPPVIYRFRFTVAQKGARFRCRWPCRFLPEAWPFLDLIQQIILEKERPGEFSSWRLRHLISLFSIGVFESRPVRRRGARLTDAQRAALADLLASNPGLRRSPAGMARRLGYSADYFTRIFRRSYGLAPRRWLLQQRLRQAAALLRESGDRIGVIAARLGYAEIYLFSRQFRRLFGVSPSRWRAAGYSALERHHSRG